MANKYGKIFEEQIKKYTPSYALIHRLPDDAQSFHKNSKLRFSSKKPFDYILWDSRKFILYALELKTVAEKSISFERTKDEKGDIHYHQIKGLNYWNGFDGTICGFIIEFRSIETTIFLNIEDFNLLISLISKKSFNFDDLKNHQINYEIIRQTRLKTRYKYDVDNFLKNMNVQK